MNPHPLLPVAHAVAGFFIAIITVTLPLVSVTYGTRTPVSRSPIQSGELEASALGAEQRGARRVHGPTANSRVEAHSPDQATPETHH